MIAHVIETIRRYYSAHPTYESVEPLRREAVAKAERLVDAWRAFLPKVIAPELEDHHNSVHVHGFLDAQAPPVGAGWEKVLRYLRDTGRPLVSIGGSLSWVGPYGLVRTSQEHIGPTGGLERAPASMKDERTREIENRCRQAVKSLGFEILSEADLDVEVDIPEDVMYQANGLVDLPTTVGKCLFWSWINGSPAYYGNVSG